MRIISPRPIFTSGHRYIGWVGLFRGFLAPFRGALFVARHGLWGYVVLPLVINVGIAVLGYRIASSVVAERWGMDGWGGWAASLALALGLMLVFQPILLAPFVDALSERTEKIVTGAIPSMGFFKSALRAMSHGVLKFFLYALSLSLTLALGSLTGIGSVLGVVLTGVFLAFDGFDYPLGRREVGFAGKWAYLVRNPGLTTGYATGTTLLFMVPFAALMAAPFAAVGATLAYLDGEKATSNVAKRNSEAPGSVGPIA